MTSIPPFSEQSFVKNDDNSKQSLNPQIQLNISKINPSFQSLLEKAQKRIKNKWSTNEEFPMHIFIQKKLIKRKSAKRIWIKKRIDYSNVTLHATIY